MRGKALRLSVHPRPDRITPAYAGKRMATHGSKMPIKDHPRVCGEKPHQRPLSLRSPGSPPRMRGKVYMRCCACLPPRITPAYAGTRCSGPLHSYNPRDHPRVCGEKDSAPLDIDCIWGSPPRMRGKEINFCTILGKMGITPAYAGKRPSAPRPAPAGLDHPRVCGEKCQPGPRCPGWAGSPPRMRGKGAHKPLRLLDRRITPAYAGKSFHSLHSRI